MKKTWLSWSTGKDSAWALHELGGSDAYEVVGLFTTVNESFDRVAMHAVRRTLLETQAAATGLPLHVGTIPWPCTNARYEEVMQRTWEAAAERGIEAIAFGDLFLEDVRQYRINLLKESALEPVFPLWNRPTWSLARLMIRSGLKATLTCVDPEQLQPDFVGREFDSRLLRDLPPSVDPCGENGEFHTFVHAGPMLAYPLRVTTGQVVERDGFHFADVYAGSNPQPTADV